MRKALPEPARFVKIDDKTVQWRADAQYTLDVAEFEACLAAADAAEQAGRFFTVRKHPDEAVRLYRGDLLPDCYDEWVLPTRERLRQKYLEAVERLMLLLEEDGDYEAAIRCGQRVLHHDPLHEETYRRLMRLHMLNGGRARALRVYYTCASVLERELGVEPNPATIKAYERLMKLEAGATQDVGTGIRAKSAKLVGRQLEWKRLLAIWRKAALGQAQFVLVTGEAGIGKTRLAEELYVWANHKGIDTARTRSYAAAGGLAYAPLIEWLREEPVQARLNRLTNVWLTEVARLLPELLVERPELPPPQPLTENWQRQRFFEAVARAVLGDGQPLLLVFDDLQWCDQETLEWLYYLLQFEPQTPLLAIGSIRSGETGPDHPLNALLFNLQRDDQLTEVDLAPLSTEETAELAAQITGKALDPDQMEQLYRDTEGNPLFLVETVRAQQSEGLESTGPQEPSNAPAASSQAPTTLPPKIYAVIQSRLNQLSPQAHELASLAATIGRSFTYDVLAAASTQAEETLVNSLDELWQRGIVREQGSDTYDFSHDKLREVTYAELSKVRQRLLHRRVAEALETVYASSLDEISGVLGEYYLQGGNSEKAIEYFYRAGQRAAAQFANDEAVAYLSRALDLTSEDDLANRYALLLVRQKVYNVQGTRELQHQDLTDLQVIAKALADDRQQSEVALELSWYSREIGDYPTALEMTKRAVGLARAVQEPRLEADGYIEWGSTLWYQGDYLPAQRQFEQALTLARSNQLRQVEVHSLYWLGTIGLFFGNYTEAKTFLEQALQGAQEVKDRQYEGYILNQLAYLTLEQGEDNYPQGRAYLEQALPISRQMGERPLERLLLANLGVLSEHHGNYTLARTHFDKALRLSRDISDRKGEGLLLSYIGNVRRHQGDYGGAKANYDQALSILQEISFRQGEARTLVEIGLLQHSLGDDEVALQHCQQALHIAQERGIRRDQGYALTRSGHALSGLGRCDEAVEAYQQALAIQNDIGQYNRGMEAKAGLARITLAKNDLTQALAYVEEILGLLENIAWCGLAEPFRVNLTSIRVLQANRDPRTQTILSSAYDLLQERAANIDDDALRRSYLENVAAHQEILNEFTAMRTISSPD